MPCRLRRRNSRGGLISYYQKECAPRPRVGGCGACFLGNGFFDSGAVRERATGRFLRRAGGEARASVRGWFGALHRRERLRGRAEMVRRVAGQTARRADDEARAAVQRWFGALRVRECVVPEAKFARRCRGGSARCAGGNACAAARGGSARYGSGFASCWRRSLRGGAEVVRRVAPEGTLARRREAVRRATDRVARCAGDEARAAAEAVRRVAGQVARRGGGEARAAARRWCGALRIGWRVALEGKVE